MALKKSEKIRRLLGPAREDGLDPRYAAYFECFNRGEYYEAHDVLEDLWLEEGRAAFNHAFYKGLIQGAGAFVHLKKHFYEPEHPVHGRRLEPAGRLLKLCLKNLSGYSAEHMGLWPVRALFENSLAALEKSQCRTNPWQPDQLPQIKTPF